MALPIDFITRTRALLGNEFDSFEAALQADVPVSIRINEKKGAPIPAADTPDNRVAWCDTGYYLPERLSFTFDPLFHAGAYYVQEASSMFLEQVIRSHVKTPVRCLDLCAAPGGKSTHLAACLPEGSLLVSNEVIRSRSHILAENIAKWGNPNCVVTNNDPKEIGRLTHFFDVIVADVPCSGLGIIRKKPDIRYKNLKELEDLPALQLKILETQASYVRPGGTLLYSTCTVLKRENEDVVSAFLAAHGEFTTEPLPLPDVFPKNETGMLTLIPGEYDTDGFFICRLRRKA